MYSVSLHGGRAIWTYSRSGMIRNFTTILGMGLGSKARIHSEHQEALLLYPHLPLLLGVRIDWTSLAWAWPLTTTCTINGGEDLPGRTIGRT